MSKRNGKPKPITTLADLTPDPRNARAHNPRNVGMIEAALGEVGAARSIVIDEDGVVLAGNATIEAAARLGMENVRVVEGDGTTIIAVRRSGLTAAQKTRLGLLDNRTAELADWNADVLAGLVAEDDALLAGLFERDELADIMAQIEKPEPPGDPGAQVDRAEELRVKWGTALGDTWALGEHRLVCGDCTDAAVVARVMGGERAGAVVTDPPYGVTDEEWDRELASGDVSLALNNTDGPVLMFGAARPDIIRNVLLITPIADRIMIWRTTRPNAGSGMFWTWQPVYCWRATFDGWDALEWSDSPTVTGGHPTQKPVGFIEKLVKMVSAHGAIVLDPFAGSGTTGIACERLGRKARMVEIDPGYCAVILERWATMTGRTPEQIGSA